MSVRIVGPMVADEVPRYQLGASLYEAYDACRIDIAAELEVRHLRSRMARKLETKSRTSDRKVSSNRFSFQCFSLIRTII